MTTKKFFRSALLFLIVWILTGCGASQTEVNIPEDAALIITGRVDSGMGWTEDELKSLGLIEVEYTNKDGTKTVYSGVPLANLLEICGIHQDAKSLVFMVHDGSSTKVPLADLNACEECIVTLQNEFKVPGLTILLPPVEGKTKLVGIYQISVE